jgi:ABC-2 type transport system ATP-binding protein
VGFVERGRGFWRGPEGRASAHGSFFVSRSEERPLLSHTFVTAAGNTIEVEHLVKRFGRNAAVNDISFTVQRGEIVGFLGPNGAGKSTTMRILTGYAPATSGVVRICGHPVAALPIEAKRRIGYMPESNPLPEDLRVREYLRWRGRLKGLGGRQLRDRMEAVMELCDLTRAGNRIIGKLSKGFRQRVGVADAILAEPEVIIMDEPTIGLDPHQILLIRDLIGSLRGRMSVIISSHILPEIEVTCDRVIIINNGRIVATGTPAELRREFIQRTTYDLEVSGDFVVLQAALADLTPGQIVERAEGAPGNDGFYNVSVHLPIEHDRGEEILGRIASRPGLRMRGLARHRATLEEVFLAATRRSWDTVTPLGAASTNGADAPTPSTPPATKVPPPPAVAPVPAAPVAPPANQPAVENPPVSPKP